MQNEIKTWILTIRKGENLEQVEIQGTSGAVESIYNNMPKSYDAFLRVMDDKGNFHVVDW